MERTKGKLYVTEDYYGGVRISTTEKNATNIDGSYAIFENTGRGTGDIEKANAEHLVECWNAHEPGGKVEKLEKEVEQLRALCYRESQVLKEALKRKHNKSMIEVVSMDLAKQAIAEGSR